jgi:hypothetical protein
VSATSPNTPPSLWKSGTAATGCTKDPEAPRPALLFTGGGLCNTSGKKQKRCNAPDPRRVLSIRLGWRWLPPPYEPSPAPL